MPLVIAAILGRRIMGTPARGEGLQGDGREPPWMGWALQGLGMCL